jgi:hypothetical protein
MLDREVLLHFRDTPTKKRVMDNICADLLRAVGEAPVPGARPTSFGGKCDLLALDSSGRLLAVEVKPRGVPTIAWAPAQVIVYARLLRLWSRHDPDAAEILSGMVDQRERLGLIATATPAPRPQLDALPVVAVQRAMSQEHRPRRAPRLTLANRCAAVSNGGASGNPSRAGRYGVLLVAEPGCQREGSRMARRRKGASGNRCRKCGEVSPYDICKKCAGISESAEPALVPSHLRIRRIVSGGLPTLGRRSR